MGMDVMGKSPTTEQGEYFRNNWWWWRPLWAYCVEVAPDLCGRVNAGSNDGDGLNAEDSAELSRILFERIDSGHTAEWEREYNEWRARLPRVDCNWCRGTGVRRDKVGREMGMREKVLDQETQILTGRSVGWCNGCGGVGRRAQTRTEYPFEVENVREFAKFLESCGGFECW